MTLAADFGGVLLYFTMLVPIWNERPLTRNDLIPGAYPLAVTAREVEFAQGGLVYADEDLLNTMAVDFGQSQSALAGDVLLRLVKDEQPPSVVATALSQLGNLPLTNPELERTVVRFFTHDDWRVRFWAVRAYGQLASPVPATLLKIALKDSVSRVKAAALDGLAGRTGTLSYTDFSGLMSHTDRRVRQAALMAAMGTSDVTAMESDLSALLARGDVADRNAMAKSLALVSPEALRDRLGRALATDAHPSVRAACAIQLGRVRSAQSQKILLECLGDKDYEVRRSAVESLAAFPEPVVVKTLAMMLGDTNVFVRRQLEETLVKIHARQAVDLAVVKTCQSQNSDARFSAYNILGRTGVSQHRHVIARALTSETGSTRIAAALKALNRLKFNESDDLVLSYINHPKPAVRQAVAGALAHSNTEAAAAGLIQLATDKLNSNEVIATAIESMGRLGDPVFSSILVKILRACGPTSRYSEAHRATACWALAKLPALNDAAVNRLVKQGSEAVIVTPDGKLFETDQVLVSAIFALAERARKNPDVMKDFTTVYRVQSRKVTSEDIKTSSGNILVPSPEVLDYSAQAKAWVEGRSATPGLRPQKSMMFLYHPVK